jgi:2-polyprenyl-3-methyl-5-hydroxy-6-metoxy-1,4-benzoquinol methylase
MISRGPDTMTERGDQVTLVRTKYGFYQYSPLPTIEQLQQYYRDKYFQEGHGSYSVSYTEEEIAYFRLKARLIYQKASALIDLNERKSFLDIGCGEGWVMSEFNSRNHDVSGLDFSSHGIEKFSPHLSACLEQGDIGRNLDGRISRGMKFNVLLLANVVEHVLDPAGTIDKIKQLMLPGALLIIVAPNDFSDLHEHLLAKKYISREFWLCYPDHLSYFNKESMTNFLDAKGLRVEAVVADNPIDLNLLNDSSNYVKDPAKGKMTHYFRARSDNFLASIDQDKLLKIYEIFGSMGVGRDLTYYCFASS